MLQAVAKNGLTTEYCVLFWVALSYNPAKDLNLE